MKHPKKIQKLKSSLSAPPFLKQNSWLAKSKNNPAQSLVTEFAFF
jgi:hypothetical protein